MTVFDTLRADEFFMLYQGALQIKERNRRLIACYVIVCGGILGMRRIEIVHLRESWIDWETGQIEIPMLDPCSCRQCWDSAYKKWLRHGFNRLQSDGFYSEDTSFENVNNSEISEKLEVENLLKILYSTRFSTKNDQPRTIPFGWSPRVTGILMEFFDEIGPYLELVPESINNYIEDAAENAEGLYPDITKSHILRKTGITSMADSGLSHDDVEYFAGHENKNSLESYLRDSPRRNTYYIYSLFGKEAQAPSVVGEEGYPVARELRRFEREPIFPINYPDERRFQRAFEQKDKKWPQIHPRSGNIPYNINGFPENVDYDVRQHDLPNHQELSPDRLPDHMLLEDKSDGYDDNDDKKIHSGLTGDKIEQRIDYEDTILTESSQTNGYHSAQAGRRMTMAVIFGSLITALMWIQSGVIDMIATQEFSALFAAGVVGVIYPPLMIWHVHGLMHDNPTDIPPRTRFDRVIIYTYLTVEKARTSITDTFRNLQSKLKNCLTKFL